MGTPSPAPDELEQYRGAVTRYIRYLVRNATDADDLAQEAFIRADRQRNSLRDPAALESWLYQIATHVSIDRLRQRAKTAERHVDEPLEDLPIPDSTQPSVLTVIQQEEMSACVRKYVAKLSDSYKAVLLMCDADGLSARETAELLQLPLTTVKMRLHRARQQMQAALEEACDFERDKRGVFVCEPKRQDRGTSNCIQPTAAASAGFAEPKVLRSTASRKRSSITPKTRLNITAPEAKKA